MWSNTPPCADCSNKGCGIYHDECEAFQEWKSSRPNKEKDIFIAYKREQKDKIMHRESRQSNTNRKFK